MSTRATAQCGGAWFPAPDLSAVKTALATAGAAPRGARPDTWRRAALAASCGALLPGDGAAVTLMSSDADRATVYSSGHVLRDLAKRELTLGAGPSLTAFQTRRPVLVRDMKSGSAQARWPLLAQEIADLPVRALITLPLHVGSIGLGVATIYRREPGLLSAADMAFTFAALDLLTVALLTIDQQGPGESLDVRWLEAGALAREQVHQATGMLIAQLGVDPKAAFLELRREATSLRLDVEVVADLIVNHHHRVTSGSQRKIWSERAG